MSDTGAQNFLYQDRARYYKIEGEENPVEVKIVTEPPRPERPIYGRKTWQHQVDLTGVSLVRAQQESDYADFSKHINITYVDSETDSTLKTMLVGTSQGFIYAPPEDYERVMDIITQD